VRYDAPHRQPQRLALSRGAGLPDNSRASELDRKKREAS
jgi:hypothetical protein